MENNLTRRLEIDHTRANVEKRIAPAVISSEAPVNRGDFIEVLIHNTDSINLERAPLSLIESHNTDQLAIGTVENIRVDGDKLRGDVRFGNSARANEVFADVQAGVVRNLSIGYRWDEYHEEGDTIKVTRWTPYEVSAVSVPADPGAGFYRSEDSKMSTETLTLDKGAKEERARINELYNLGDQYDAKDLAEQLIRSGGNAADMKEKLLERSIEQKPIDTGDFFVSTFGPKEEREFSLTNVLRSIANPKDKIDIGYELEVSQELQRQTGKSTQGILMPLNTRAVTYGGTGSNLVETQHLASNFIDVLRNRSAVMSLGVTHLNGLVGNVSIPRKTGTSTAYWIAGDGADSLTESTPAFDNLTLSPKTVGGLVSFSHKMLVQSDPAIEQLVRNDLANMLAVEVDAKAVNGDGTGNTPVGILNTVGIGSNTYANGGNPSYADMVGLEGDLSAANADLGSMSYLTTPALATTLKTTDVGTDTGQFIWSGGRERGQGQVNGFDAYYSGNVPAGYAIFGNWSDLIIGNWGVLEIDADPYGTNFAKGSVTVRAMMDIDFAVRHAASFTEIHEAAV
nr:hypothetical protein 6 [Gammaproteobacteria bacterium]